MHCLDEWKERFPRLQKVTDFTYSPEDFTETAETPAGPVDVLYLADRSDFEKAIIALAYKNEPRELPRSMGAMFIGGIADYVAYEKTCVLVLSRGPYSAVPAEAAGLPEDDWLEKSLAIRKNHEIAHFIQRKLFPENKDALKDEIKADMVGLIKAFGTFDRKLAETFLGIEGEAYREGGRLRNYLKDGESLDDAIRTVRAYLDTVAAAIRPGEDAFDTLIRIETAEAAEKR